MQRLTLILSDLYLPEDSAEDASPAAARALPHFEALLRFADGPKFVGDWRRWLVQELGVPELAEYPVAELAARVFIPLGASGSAWMATPVSLSARMDHVRLEERGLLRVDEGEAESCRMEFAAQFAPRFRLHPAGERGFVLTGMDAAAAITVDPARLLGTDIGDSLPRGTGSNYLRQLGSEVEMWLHDSSLNESRVQEGKPRISTFWFWGGGRQASGPLLEKIPPYFTAIRLHGSDPFLAGLDAATGPNLPSVPTVFASLDPRFDHHVVELAPMTGTGDHSLAALDSSWFAAARHALANGVLSELVLVANDRCFRISARAHWRFWRRRRSWFENLGSSIRIPKA